MFDEHIAQPNPYLEAVKDHWWVVLRVFAVVLLLSAAGAYLTRQYSASAALALNPQDLHEPNAWGVQQSPVEAAWSALSDRQISAITAQFQLGHGMAHLRARGQIFTYVRSKISINALPGPADSVRQVEVSYTGESPASAMGVANAIAQQISQAKAPARAPLATALIAAPNSQLEKSRLRLKMLSETPLPDTVALRAQVEQRLIKDADLRAARGDAATKLGVLAAQSAQLNAAANPQVGAKPAPHASELALLTAQESHLRVRIAGLDDQIASNQNAAEVLRQKIASGKELAREYTAAQQRYSTLLQVQEALDEGDSARANTSISSQTPLFMIVKAAASADPIGVAFMPLFWFLSVTGALLAAALSVYLAEQFAPAVHERAPTRSFHLS